MKKLLSMMAALFLTWPAFAQVQPIDDPSKLLDDAARAKVMGALMANYDATKVHIVVWLPTLAKDDVLLEKSVEYFKTKGIGQKDQDNGVLILLDWANHRSRIEVGYGLEGVMTDARTKAVQDNVMNPLFRKGDIASGLLAGISVLSGYSQEWLAEKTSPSRPPVHNWLITAIAAIIIGGCLMLIIVVQVRRREREAEERERAQDREAMAARSRRQEEQMRSATRINPAWYGAGLGASSMALHSRSSSPSRPKPKPSRSSSSSDYSSSGSGYSSSSSSGSSSSDSSPSYDSGGGSSGGGGSDSSF